MIIEKNMKKNPFDELIELYEEEHPFFFGKFYRNKELTEMYRIHFGIESHLLNEWYDETSEEESELIVYMTLLFARLVWNDHE